MFGTTQRRSVTATGRFRSGDSGIWLVSCKLKPWKPPSAAKTITDILNMSVERRRRVLCLTRISHVWLDDVAHALARAVLRLFPAPCRHANALSGAGVGTSADGHARVRAPRHDHECL